MGETGTDRARMLQELPTCRSTRVGADQHAGAGLKARRCMATTGDPLEFVRTIAVARILMPNSYVRLSAGRSDERRDTGAVFPGGRQLDLLRRAAADHRQPGCRSRSCAVRGLGINMQTIELESDRQACCGSGQ